MRLIVMTAAVALAGWTLPAAAQDRAPCGKELVCASDPQTILQAMRAARLEASLAADEHGDPVINVTGRPYHFDLFFYGCEQHRHCDSLRFEVSFGKDAQATVALANKWNAGHRFVTASVKDNGAFVLSYDIGMIGGTTKRNFADTLDWWNSMLGESADFFAAELKG
ncbi:YbjN domain-containing protein [Sphingomonas sp. KR3-1]|uniref:YbjN domain-containing protein n=1 Tax=Sphingomonas sp. KR3-1 TaxID=3156611 RepID=UPI0032B4E681